MPQKTSIPCVCGEMAALRVRKSRAFQGQEKRERDFRCDGCGRSYDETEIDVISPPRGIDLCSLNDAPPLNEDLAQQAREEFKAGKSISTDAYLQETRATMGAESPREPVPRKHPLQYTHLDNDGIRRFRRNEIVIYLLDCGPFDMNHLAIRGFSREDYEQFAQLIGYSVSGFSDLSYVSDETLELADRAPIQQ